MPGRRTREPKQSKAVTDRGSSAAQLRQLHTMYLHVQRILNFSTALQALDDQKAARSENIQRLFPIEISDNLQQLLQWGNQPGRLEGLEGVLTYVNHKKQPGSLSVNFAEITDPVQLAGDLLRALDDEQVNPDDIRIKLSPVPRTAASTPKRGQDTTLARSGVRQRPLMTMSSVNNALLNITFLCYALEQWQRDYKKGFQLDLIPYKRHNKRRQGRAEHVVHPSVGESTHPETHEVAPPASVAHRGRSRSLDIAPKKKKRDRSGSVGTDKKTTVIYRQALQDFPHEQVKSTLDEADKQKIRTLMRTLMEEINDAGSFTNLNKDLKRIKYNALAKLLKDCETKDPATALVGIRQDPNYEKISAGYFSKRTRELLNDLEQKYSNSEHSSPRSR